MNNKLIELYKEYDKLCEQTKLEYQPDGFLVMIHEHYLNNNKIRLPYPLYATWDITNYCNLHCIFCSASALGNKEKIDSPDSLKIAKKMISNGIKYVSIRGGEPTLVKQLKDIVKLFINNNIFVEIVSNGSGINNELLKSFKGLNKNFITNVTNLKIIFIDDITNPVLKRIANYYLNINKKEGTQFDAKSFN